MNYSDYQNQPSSEKLTLATLEASKRLVGWTLDSGNVYTIPFPYAVIARLEDSGTAYTEAASEAGVTEGKYFLDRDTSTLYVHATGSGHPNARFLVVTIKLYFASSPITLPHDLADGFEVYWEPLVSDTSRFGVEIDTVSQVSEAIEGSGTLTLHNDFDFWPANFDKLFFENQRCLIYSHNRDLAVTQAKLLFKGRVEKKTYSDKQIRFQLKDQFAELRAPIDLGTIEDLELRTGSDVAKAKQRMILGRVTGHVPVNVDQVLDGYPITGTVSINTGSTTLTGSGVAFNAELSPDDILVLDGVEYTIASVDSNTQVTLTEEYSALANLSGAAATVIPDLPKRYMNRVWHIAGHPLREPSTTVTAGSSVTRIFVADASDIYPGDWIYIGTLGSGELVQVDDVVGARRVDLVQSLETIPAIGTSVRRPAVQNVRIGDVSLVYYQDYTLDASTATLTLRDTAEANSSPIRQLNSDLTFTNGSRTVTGSGFKSAIFPGYMLGVVGNADFFEVQSVDSDEQLTLRTASTFSDTDTGRYKSLIFDPQEHTLSLDVLGRTEDGTTNGALIKTAPGIVRAMLQDAGLTSDIDSASFDTAEVAAFQHLGIVTPDKFNGQNAATYRDIINKANRSVFGSLVQNSEFKFAYEVLAPHKPVTATRFSEADLLSFTVETTAENAVKTSIVQYCPAEYDYLTGAPSIRTSQKSSDTATHILKTAREKTISTYLVSENDARIQATRWAFLLEVGSGRVKFTTKLQGAALDIGDVVDVEHRKFFERFGGASRRRLMLVESVKKSGNLVEVEATDLSNAFNRVGCFTSSTADFADATEDERIYSGYFTDEYGLIDNDPNTHGINLFW